jgi:bifunctional non-homologous end joining protein LigD
MTPHRAPVQWFRFQDDGMADKVKLADYHAKRSADRTPEPMGAVATSPGGRLFVVQKHAARRLHYDFRLELNGVLLSWAVPKGPSYDPANKQLAVHVEDHPLDYADFEGIIPAGNYGAGAVIVWDRGEWLALEDPVAGLEKGKLLFELKGYKLRGRWTLVKMKKTEKDWLLIKERDALAGPGRDAELPQGSVFSGLTIEELQSGADRAADVRKSLDALNAPKRTVHASRLAPMLAERRATPFSREGWIFELKYDGWRMLAEASPGDGQLFTRNGREATSQFPELAHALASLPFEHLVLDGELVVHDDAGLPSFQRLQQRALLTRAPDVRSAALELPATLYVFDLLGFEDRDLRSLPLVERKRLLRQVLPAAGPLRYSDHIETQGEAFYAEVQRMGLEGMVAKRADSPYRSGRSRDWIKVRADLTDDFVVVGFTRPQGSRAGFGALHLAAYAGRELVYAGRAGSGFTEKQLDEVRETLESLRRKTPACSFPGGGEPPKNSIWVEPRLVCEVRYREMTDDGLLRQPVFLRFRDDKRPDECVLRQAAGPVSEPDPGPAGDTPAGDAPADGAPADGDGRGTAESQAGAGARSRRGSTSIKDPERHVPLTNLDKVFWPEQGYTKGDLIDYYRSVADWALPWLRDRPVVLTRFPDGIHGKSFFQKDAPSYAPDWLRRIKVWSEDSQRELSYFVCDDVASLTYIANMASIPLHIWSSRVGSLEQPDWCILDLDPKEAPFEHVIRVARAVHELCDEVALPAYVKTSGSSGLHVLVPLGRQCTHEQARLLGELLARTIVMRRPDITTIARVVSQRAGKVYIDYLQNGHGKLLVAPFSARPMEGAPVSTPLRWREVKKGLRLLDYTIRTVPRRLARMKKDPWEGLLDERPDLVAALERLGETVKQK